MTRSKKILISVLAIIISFFLFFAWYQYQYSMNEVMSYQINDESLNQKLLIATQGSEFKDAITANIINEYNEDSIFIKVIDVSYLSKIAPKSYTAIVIMHTWENWKPPIDVARFIDKIGAQDNMVVLATSGQGNYKMQQVDALTGESKMESVDYFTNQIIEKLNRLLK